ncbi:MAG: tetratricopeptide repeat protein [Woeseiaceae bacterium]|nr:tetratricopeptide repeat protein [Woeseiaceae bacterium]
MIAAAVHKLRYVVTVAVVASIGLTQPAYPQTGEQDTIGSLGNKRYKVRPGNAIVGGSDKARDSYRDFLDLVSDDPELRAEAMRRLGDLELDAMESAALADSIDTAATQNAVELFTELLEAYPDYRRNDTVLYQLARAYETGGRMDESLAVLDDLVSRYPDTEHLHEVQFRRGEMLFLRKRYEEAEGAYRDVVAFGEASRFYEQSLYKLGWTQFKLARHEQSLRPFFDLLDRKIGDIELDDGEDRLTALGRAERELVEDTFRVLSISFSYMNAAASITEYLASRGQPSYGWVIYLNLGDLYLDKERYVDAAETFDAFSARNPDHPKAPLLHVEVIEAYRDGGFPSLVLDAKKAFVERYGMDQPFWTINAPEHNTAAVAHLKANLTDLAQYYHAEAQKNGKRADYREAALWYRKFLDYFPDETDSANTNFLLAEILFESGDHRGATDEYERTAYAYPPHERSSEAAYAAILAYREHERSLSGEARAAWHQRYLDSGLRFGETYPGHPEAAAVLTTVAEDLFASGEFDLALAVAQTVVTREPPVQADLGRTAWTVVAHAQFDLGRFADAESAYYRLRPLIPANESAARDEIDARIASSIYKQGELARDRGDLETAVVHFTRIAEAVPDSEIRATAEYDAAAALIAMQAWSRATGVLEAYRRNFPDSEYADDISAKLAVTYQASGRAAEAAGEYERMAEAPSSDESLRREALWKAAELYRDGGQASSERRVLSAIVARYPRPVAESIEARYRLLQLAEMRNDSAAQSALLRDLVEADATAGAERSDRTRYLAAIASLQLAEPSRRSFVAMKLDQPLADSMKLKRSLMENVLEAYTDAAAYGVAAVTTAATYRLGEVYQQMGRDLMASERPAELDELALEQYELLLEEQAYPFEEKAIELFEANAARAANGVYDEWVVRSYQALATLMPARYAKLERSEDVVTALN